MNHNLRSAARLIILAALMVLPQAAMAVVPVVKVVPWVPSDPSIAHDTYAGKTITLKGTVGPVAGTTWQKSWDFGDGSAVQPFADVTNAYDLGATHTYAGAVGTVFTAKLTVRDKANIADSVTVNYKVIMRANNLTSNVNVAIDEGLWFLHRTMQRYTNGASPEGDWDNLGGGGSSSCAGSGFDQTACDNIASERAINASNIQAFEVNGHLETGLASNPYTETVNRGLRRMFTQLTTINVGNKNINIVTLSCPVPVCTYNADSNGNGIGITTAGGSFLYQIGQFMDALVATGTPNAIAPTGAANIIGRTYKAIVQDMVDTQAFCQGGNSGGWRYGCNDITDNSTSQWVAIGNIGAFRTFGILLPQHMIDANKVSLTNTQNADGRYGYTSVNPVWGPFGSTPSGLVQAAQDGLGRGDARWDKTEKFYRDNFDSAGLNGQSNPKLYTYGLFSFTKAMLLHAPGGVLTPLTCLKSSALPDIDWYAAETGQPQANCPAGGNATSNGVARTLVARQLASGAWTGHSDTNSGSFHFPFETSWSIIMLQRTVFVACVTNLTGRGTPSSPTAPARVDLTWTGIPNVDHYDVLRGTASGGPYVKVGSSVKPAYSDRTGLVNNTTYFYVLQPINAAGGQICQSNQATVKVPLGR